MVSSERLILEVVQLVGQRLGHYRILEKLGEGGMVVVYKAQDTWTVLSPSIFCRRRRSRMPRGSDFVQEAKSAAALNHPNIIHIYDIDSAAGAEFMAMEYVEGRTLSQLIGHQGLPLNEVLTLANQIADALAAAHAAGIVHRNIKVANIMVILLHLEALLPGPRFNQRPVYREMVVRQEPLPPRLIHGAVSGVQSPVGLA